MGGHGGLNILPQKSWHVYRLDNRLRVDKDKEAEEQRRVQKHDKERGERLRQKLRRRTETSNSEDLKHVHHENDSHLISRRDSTSSQDGTAYTCGKETRSEPRHINLFEKEMRAAEDLQRKHKVYLKKKLLHDEKDHPAFREIQPWYAKKPEHAVLESSPVTDSDQQPHPRKPLDIQQMRQRRLLREASEKGKARQVKER